jgi:nucleotide-binding universal stress UspA family protein
VLTIRERPIQVFLPGENPIRARRVLAPTDFSDLSISALKETVALAKRFGAQVDVIYVNQPPPYTDADYGHLVMAESALREAAQGQFSRLEAAVPDLKEVMRERLVRMGNPAHEILQAALVLNSELIVIGTHGHTGLKRLTLGSTAERVLRHAACPVLVLRK